MESKGIHTTYRLNNVRHCERSGTISTVDHVDFPVKMKDKINSKLYFDTKISGTRLLHVFQRRFKGKRSHFRLNKYDLVS